jgi:1-acyl-sn-glycerol-3-phosphate acyltransferase
MNYYMRFMAKIELMHIPLLGNLLKKCGVFYVNRGNSDVTAIKTAMQTLKDGARVAIFPEGRRVSAEEASAAKTGAIMLASRTGAPIVPVYIPKVKHFGTAVDVYIGKPYTIERVRGGSEVYAAYADELMRRINALAPEKVPG